MNDEKIFCSFKRLENKECGYLGFDGSIRDGVQWKYWGWGSMEVLGMGSDGSIRNGVRWNY